MKFDLNPEGWIAWPEREDLSLEFMRLLASAEDGGAAVSECWLAAGSIDFIDDESWHRAWAAAAAVNRGRAVAAAAAGHLATARSNWLRALNYYLAAVSPADLSPDSRHQAITAMRECAAHYLACREGGGEIVSIPWLSDFTLQGYYLPPRNTRGPAPAVISIGEPGHHKEEFLIKLARHASERGMALLAVDLLGDGTGRPFDEVSPGHQPEHAIAPIIDYLFGRDDVDDKRIAILSDGCRSSFVARGIAFDPRLAAAVCDGGIWDLHMRSVLSRQAGAIGIGPGPEAATDRILRSIRCPLLIAAGERGWLQADRITELADQLRAGRRDRDVTLKIFGHTDIAASHGLLDDPTLANEFIFDWIASRLGVIG